TDGYVVFVRDGAKGEDGTPAPAPTDEQIRSAIAGSPEANPFSYDVKFAQDTTRQIAEPFRTGVFDTTDLKTTAGGTGTTTTKTVIHLLPDNTSVPNNVSAKIPFFTAWEGALRYSTIDNGDGNAANRNRILRITRNFVHFVGQTDSEGNSLEFTEAQPYIFRMQKDHAEDVPMNLFDTSVGLPESIANDPRYTAHETQNIKIDMVFELFRDQDALDAGTPSTRSSYTAPFNIDWSGVGVRYYQNAPIIGGGEGGVSLEAVANEMRADGDVATIPAETLPGSAQITATAEAQTSITVPDNALFRGLSTVNASFSSTIINAGNSINVGIRYTDDDTIPPTGGLR
nr:hypothetical protein [Pseudomonadota bacterium]